MNTYSHGPWGSFVSSFSWCTADTGRAASAIDLSTLMACVWHNHDDGMVRVIAAGVAMNELSPDDVFGFVWYFS